MKAVARPHNTVRAMPCEAPLLFEVPAGPQILTPQELRLRRVPVELGDWLYEPDASMEPEAQAAMICFVLLFAPRGRGAALVRKLTFLARVALARHLVKRLDAEFFGGWVLVEMMGALPSKTVLPFLLATVAITAPDLAARVEITNPDARALLRSGWEGRQSK